MFNKWREGNERWYPLPLIGAQSSRIRGFSSSPTADGRLRSFGSDFAALGSSVVSTESFCHSREIALPIPKCPCFYRSCALPDL